MSKILIVVMSALLLAACSNQHSRRGDVFDRAGRDMEAAARLWQVSEALCGVA